MEDKGVQQILLAMQMQQEQHAKQQQEQSALVNALLERLAMREGSSQAKPAGSSIDALEKRITDFAYEPEEGATFEKWYSRYEDLFEKDAEALEEDAKVRMLLRHVNFSVENRYLATIAPHKASNYTLKETVEKLKKMFGDKSTIFEKRLKMLNMRMSKSHTDDLRVMASTINRAVESAQVKDIKVEQFKTMMFLTSIDLPQFEETRFHLLSILRKNEETSMETLLDECDRLHSLHQESMAVQTQGRTSQLNYVKKNQQRNPSEKGRKKQFDEQRKEKCNRCGVSHSNECFFLNKECLACGRKGHKSTMCKNKPKEKRSKQSMNSIRVMKVKSEDFEIEMQMNGKAVRPQVDTGADLTFISKEIWKDIGEPECSLSDCKPICANGTPLMIVGKFKANLEVNGKCAQGYVHVTTAPLRLLGKDFISQLEVLKMNWTRDATSNVWKVMNKEPQSTKEYEEWIKKEYPGIVEEGLGLCTKVKATLKLKEGAQPVFRNKRPVPLASITKVEKELDRLEKLNVIRKVDTAKWAAPIIVVEKANGSTRLCADFSTGLNDAIELHAHPLPLPETIFAGLNGGKLFSQIDFADAYLQVELDEKAKEMCGINTHKGLYRYERLPFGVKSAPEIFQQVMDTMLAGSEGAVAYLDDLIMMGKTKKEHDDNLRGVLSRISNFGFKLKLEKCKFGSTSIKYLGFIVDKDGRKPDLNKIDAIRLMPAPTDVATLRSFLGMVTYYGQFIAGLHELRAPLDNLLRKDVECTWSETCQNAFKKILGVLETDLSLVHYDPSKEILVAADASGQGIGAVLMHRASNGAMKAIFHASRALKPAERNYGQIDKEERPPRTSKPSTQSSVQKARLSENEGKAPKDFQTINAIKCSEGAVE